jgi:exopolyphosphatase/guanosine-5'-triphosphate,3'-diphosphate pyrophosphatase
VRLTNQILGLGGSPNPRDKYRKIRDQVRFRSHHAVSSILKTGFELAVGSSGTIENLAELALRIKSPQKRLSMFPAEERKLLRADLPALTESLCAMTMEERAALPGISPRRAEVIVAGAAIIQTLMEELRLDEILVSDRGLQHGLLLDYLRSSRWGFFDARMSVREISVLRLAKLCNVAEEHARHVAYLALQLFDSAAALNFFTPEPQERELLSYAALLHDVGMLLSLKDHHKHSHYLIRNAELLGFFTGEIEIMASAAWYHSKKNLNRGQNPVDLPPSAQAAAQRGGLILRLCECLDRCHKQSISGARFVRAEKQYQLLTEGPAREECEMELASVSENLHLLERFFGHPFALVFSGPDR